jgi:proteasome accessory factor A
MSEWATALKVGTTALVLELIERGAVPQIELAQPVEALKAISRDQDYSWIIELSDGRKISAVDVQRLYLRAAQQLDFAGEPETAWLLQEWENVLNDLQREVALTRDRIDWVAKKFLLGALQEEEGLSWSDPWLQSIDLEYHNIDPEQGLYYELLRQGQFRRVVTEEEISAAILHPPETTRAFFRGRSVAKFSDAITAIQWDEVVFRHADKPHQIVLPEPTEADPRLRELNELLRRELPLPEFLAMAAARCAA